MANYIERDERCVFVGNLEARVTEEILWELFLQVKTSLEVMCIHLRSCLSQAFKLTTQNDYKNP